MISGQLKGQERRRTWRHQARKHFTSWKPGHGVKKVAVKKTGHLRLRKYKEFNQKWEEKECG